LADCFVISRYVPMTEEIVSSMREMIDLRKLPFETTLSALGEYKGFPVASLLRYLLR